MAKAMDSTVLLFAVARPPEPATSVELQAVLDDAREHYEEGFRKLLQIAVESNITVETEIAVGHPAEQITHKAETMKADLVILVWDGAGLRCLKSGSWDRFPSACCATHIAR